jgi:hypothetical protein
VFLTTGNLAATHHRMGSFSCSRSRRRRGTFSTIHLTTTGHTMPSADRYIDISLLIHSHSATTLRQRLLQRNIATLHHHHRRDSLSLIVIHLTTTSGIGHLDIACQTISQRGARGDTVASLGDGGVQLVLKGNVAVHSVPFFLLLLGGAAADQFFWVKFSRNSYLP